MSEPLTKRLNQNLSPNKYSIKSQICSNLKINQNKIPKKNKIKNKNKSFIKNDNMKIKVKRKTNRIINSRNGINNIKSDTNNTLSSNYNKKIIPKNNLVFLIKNNINKDNNLDKFNKEIGINNNNEKYTKDSDLYPNALYINNYNNNYINISNITIENNNNEKSQNKEKENDNSKNEEIKKSFSDKNLVSKKSLKEEIIISDESIINKENSTIDDKTIEFFSGEKGSNLSCLLSSTKGEKSDFNRFFSKSKKYTYKHNINSSLNIIETRKKDKNKKRQINISLNYRNRNEINNIYSNNKFFHNKTFFKESKSVTNFLLDLKKNKYIKEKEEKINNSVTFRKKRNHKLKSKSREKDSTFHMENIKKVFQGRNDNIFKDNKNSILRQNLSLTKNSILNNNHNKNKRDLSYSVTKKSYKNNINGNIIKNKNNSKNKINMNIENKKIEIKIKKPLKNTDRYKINNSNKLFKENRNSLNIKLNNKKIQSIDISNQKYKIKQFTTPISFPNSNFSKKRKLKEYPNMVKKGKDNLTLEKYTKKIKSINVICKVGNSGSFQKKLNQDNYFITNNFLGNTKYTFMGVCDGHGIYGQNISSYLKEHLPMNVQEELIDQNIIDLSNINITIFSEIIESIYINTNSQMNSDERIDSSLSGSTCISGLFTPSHFYCINVGDSRCVLFKYFKSKNHWTFSSLSRDHKPSDTTEKSRIIENGGIVESFIDEEGNHIGPERVWVKGILDKSSSGPGLAMSRSFGDQIAHSVGVVVSPEILEHPFSEEDKIILLASDGIWEFIKNEEILNIVQKYYEKNNAKGALEEIYYEADKRWREKEGVVDDITAIIVFLE